MALGFAVVGVYKCGLSWWVEPLLKWRDRRKFTAEIKEKLWFLFSEHGGKIVPNQGTDPQPQQYPFARLTVVTLEADGLRFLLAHHTWRDELNAVSIVVSPEHAPRDSYD